MGLVVAHLCFPTLLSFSSHSVSFCQSCFFYTVPNFRFSNFKLVAMAEEKDAFFVGVYNGRKRTRHSVAAADMDKVYEEPYSSRAFDRNSSSKRLQDAQQFNTSEVAGSSEFSHKNFVLGGGFRAVWPTTCLSCILEFDGASKRNPGPSGAGAVLRAEDGSKIYRLREGVGIQTNSFAEYRGLILGLKHAIQKGYKHIDVKGDSVLVCNQVQGSWKIKNQNIAALCNEAKELKNKFLSFKIDHVPREYNSEADVQAKLGINLQAGQVEEDCEIP